MTQARRHTTASARTKFFNERHGAPGAIHFRPDAPPPQITLLDYNQAGVQKIDIKQPEECRPYLDSESISWVDVGGLGSEETWHQLKQVFNLHPLALEDIIHIPQRPKMEEYEDQLVIIARMVSLRQGGKSFMTEQISLVVGKHYLLSVQEEPYYDCLQLLPSRYKIR